MEKWFFNNKIGTGDVADVLENFITGVGKPRIDAVQAATDYFKDLEDEYNYLQQLDGQVITIDHLKYTYKMVNPGDDLEVLLEASADVFTIFVYISVEGCHALNCGLNPQQQPCNPAEVLSNTQKLKNWQNKPLFVTFAHHFYNELCGHAKSLTGLIGKTCDQSFGLNTGFTDLGKQVLKALLDNSEGKRILIDIKHMSKKSREEYFQLLDADYPDELIPIVASHGAVTGNQKDYDLFLNDDINFSDDEILRIAKSRGLFGIQLDERRIASKTALNKAKGNISRKSLLYNWSRLVWQQIKHIAELLDENGLPAWNIQCLGSDNDGIVNPLNGYWTSEEFDYLDDYLLKHAYNYEKDEMKNLKNSSNKIHAEEIVTRFMQLNIQEFMIKNYK